MNELLIKKAHLILQFPSITYFELNLSHLCYSYHIYARMQFAISKSVYCRNYVFI
jgi:hypothetical protein